VNVLNECTFRWYLKPGWLLSRRGAIDVTKSPELAVRRLGGRLIDQDSDHACSHHIGHRLAGAVNVF